MPNYRQKKPKKKTNNKNRNKNKNENNNNNNKNNNNTNNCLESDKQVLENKVNINKNLKTKACSERQSSEDEIQKGEITKPLHLNEENQRKLKENLCSFGFKPITTNSNSNSAIVTTLSETSPTNTQHYIATVSSTINTGLTISNNLVKNHHHYPNDDDDNTEEKGKSFKSLLPNEGTVPTESSSKKLQESLNVRKEIKPIVQNLINDIQNNNNNINPKSTNEFKENKEEELVLRNQVEKKNFEKINENLKGESIEYTDEDDYNDDDNDHDHDHDHNRDTTDEDISTDEDVLTEKEIDCEVKDIENLITQSECENIQVEPLVGMGANNTKDSSHAAKSSKSSSTTAIAADTTYYHNDDYDDTNAVCTLKSIHKFNDDDLQVNDEVNKTISKANEMTSLSSSLISLKEKPQGKVIVHRIIQENDQNELEKPQKQQEIPTDCQHFPSSSSSVSSSLALASSEKENEENNLENQERKVSKDHNIQSDINKLKDKRFEKNSDHPSTSQRNVKVIIHQIFVENEENPNPNPNQISSQNQKSSSEISANLGKTTNPGVYLTDILDDDDDDGDKNGKSFTKTRIFHNNNIDLSKEFKSPSSSLSPPFSPPFSPTLSDQQNVQIHELSDSCSGEFNSDNPPVVCEFESESEHSESLLSPEPEMEPNFSIEIIREDNHSINTIQQQEDLRLKRAQKRAALESHFLPQMLSPRYLDSILEETSDMSDGRSECSENQLSRSASNASTTSLDCNKVKKANAIFPKSQLDFSKPHKHGPLPKVIQKPIIREEPIALVLEAKLIEAQNEAEEICSRLSSVLTPESEAAEIVYIDSASSSISDLLELDLEQNLNENSNDHYNYDLDTDVNDIISKPLLEQNFNLTKDQREKTPVNELPSLSSSVGSQHLETKLNSLKEKEEEPLNFHPEIIQSNENLNENLKENLKENSNVTVGENAEHGKSEKKKLSSLDEEEFLKENLKEVNKQSYLNDFKNVPRDEEFLLKEKENIKVSNENEVKEENNDKNEEIEIEFENLLTKELSKNFLNEISCSGATQTTGQTDKNSLTLKFTELEQKPQTKSENFKTGIETESETEIETKIETETETLPKSSTDNHLYLLELEKEMDKVREILNQSEAFLNESNERNHLNQLNQSLNSENTQSPPPIPPPPLNFLTNYPPSDNSNTTDFTSTISSTNMNSNYLTEKENVSLNNLNENSNQNQNSNLNSKTLTRQASNDSYCSDSTNHSQCTAIHLDSLDTKDSDNPYNDFINLSDNLKQKWLDHRNDSFEQAQQLQLISDNNKNNNNNNNNDNLNNEEIKKLRLLCTEKLASLPYGEVVLEELAEVAKNIGELRALHDTNKMPYPLPDLPHINHLQVSLNKNDSKSLKEIKEAWLGLPTQNDPKVLLCLSPGQKAIIQESSDKKPDDLLDAHQKFIDRRGYYEFSEDEMKAMDLAHNDEKHIIETTAIMRKLRKSLTPTSSQTPSRSPTPPPIPPPPIPIKSSETIAKAQNMTSIHSNAKSFFMTNNTNNDSNNIETNKSHNDSDRQVTKENQELISNKQNSLADQSSVYETSHFNEITNNNKNRLLEIISDKNEIKPNTSSENIKVIETKPSSLEVESIAVVDAPPSTKEQIIEKSTKETSETAPLLSESESEKLKLDSSDLNKQFPTMLGMENELSKMFPSMGQHDIFDSKYKRFSNIESFTEPNYCQQLLSTQPKRHSHIETKSFESKKCIQNGKVLYDFETSSHDIENDGKKDLQNKDKLFFPYVNQKEESFSSKDFKPRETAFSTKSAETKESLESMESRKGAQASNNGKTFEIMSDLNINSEKQNIRNDNAFNDRSHTRKQQISDDLASKTSSTIGSFSSAEPSASASAKEKVHTLEIQVENDGKSNENRKENKNENKNENENINKNEYDFINKERQWSSQSHFHEKETKLQKGFGNTYEEFRQRAKDAIDSFSSPIFTDTSNSSKLFNETPNDKMNVKKSLGVDQEKLFKEFDDLHEKIEKELNKPKRSLYDQQRDKSSSLFDLDRLNLYQRSQIDEFKRQHSEHLEELEKEIERSFKSRQARLSMPRNLENLQNFNANAYVRDVPIHREENGKEFYQIPVKRIYNHNNPNENQNIIPNQNEKIYEIPIQKEMKSSDFASSTSETSHHFYEKDVKKTSSKEEKVYEIPIHRQAGEEKFKSSSGFQFPSSYDVPIQREIPVQREKAFFPSKEEEQANKVYQIPIQKEYEQAPAVPPLPIYQPETPSTARSYDIPIQVERGYESATDCVDNHSRQYRRAESMFDLSDTLPARPHTTSAYYPHIDDWSKYISDLGSSENIARPFAKEVEICHQRQRPNTIRAPRLSVSTNDLSYSTPTYDVHNAYNVRRTQAPMMMMNSNSQQKKPMYSSCYSMIERNPNPTYISTTGRRGVSPAPQNHYDRKPSSSSSILNEQDPKQRRGSLPKEIHEQQLKFIQSKEEELRSEFERLESERRRLLNAMEKVQQMPKQTRQALQTPQFRSQHRLPTLSEDEVFRQQMAEEWLNKVAEREERRLQKIIKISKAHESENVHSSRTSGSESTVHKSTKPDLSGEFLKKVQERRSKLHMPADSDWESGAESQPITQGNASESEDLSSVKILEGQSEADIKQMPRHLKEFARFSNHETEKIDGGHRDIHQEEERRQEANDNSQCSALKKTSIITTYKTSRQPIAPVRRSSNKTTTIPVIGNNNGLPVQDSSDMVAQQKQHQQKIHSRTDTAHVASVKKASAKHSHDQIIATANTGEKVLLRNTGVSKATGMPPKPKQTRFQLTSNRRSWSENDLLHEIDRELKLAKGFLFADVGIWTPKSSTPATSVSDLEKLSTAPTPPPPPSKPIWTPQPSPVPGRKEFRPVRFESPVLPRRYIISNNENNNSNSNVQPPWSYTNGNHIPNFQRSTNSCTNLSTPTTNVSESPTNYSESIVDAPNYLPSSASVSDKIKSFERSASTSELDRPFVRRRAYQDRKPAVYKPNEVIFNVKQEYMSEPETEYDRPKKMAQLGRRQYDGIGPVTNDGMPIILRSEVKEPHQHEWYKRLYQTIHKQKGGDDYVIRYKCQKGRIPYKAGGYQSEPEPNYDSDYSTYKYRTYNPRRLQSVSSVTNVRTGANYSSTDKLYGTMPNPVKSGQISYKNQPGRIENYVTGHSSVSEKEHKEWWDEVMDIFNGHLDQAKLSPHYTEGNLSRALARESGYTSDSNLVFRKKEVPLSSALSPVEQKQAYKSLQAGGEPPLFGFRKPAPEKPKGCVEEFEFIQITPTLTKIRVSFKEQEPEPEPESEAEPEQEEVQEEDCSKASLKSPKEEESPSKTSKDQVIQSPKVEEGERISTTMYAGIPKKMPSFLALAKKKEELSNELPQAPPLPPNRNSSCTKASTKITKRHEQCFQPPGGAAGASETSKSNPSSLKKTLSNKNEALSRSKSAGAVSNLLASLNKTACKNTFRANREPDNLTFTRAVRLRSISPLRRQSRLIQLRQTNRSPVAFGRSISKERSFAEEKKRLENILPANKTNFEASTNILRDPSLKSPQEVKEAVRSYATCTAYARSKSLPRCRSRNEPYYSLNTTMRHTMCFPQTRPIFPFIDYTKRVTEVAPCNRAKFAKSLERASASNKSKVRKTISSDSLARTNSTFSIDSIPAKVKASKEQSIPKATKASSTKISKPMGSPAKKPSPNLQQSKSETNLGKKLSIPSKTIPKSADKPTQTKPLSIKKSKSSHYFHPSNGPSSTSMIEEYSVDSVRDKTNFWNDFNKQQQCKSLPPASKYVSLKSMPSCSRSPTREQLSSLYTEDYYNYIPTPEPFEFEEGPCFDDLVWQYEKKASKVDRTPSQVTDIARPHSPQHHGSSLRRFSPTREVRIPFEQNQWLSDSKEYLPERNFDQADSSSRNFSPTREIRVPLNRNVRSPSRRRIDNIRTQHKGETSKVIRASSLSSADDRSKKGLYLCSELSHSATSLNFGDRHSPTCRYRNNSERFTDLNRFYSTLERVGQLERATSSTDFRPIRKDSELLDFEEWRKVRLHERAEKELHYLVSKLKQEQREKDLLFRSKDVEDVKWRQEFDFGLHAKEKSVEDIRGDFETKLFLKDHDHRLGSRPSMLKPSWRRNTVGDLAPSLEVKASYHDKQTKEQSDLPLSNQLVSTLSREQITKITQQLNEIYSGKKLTNGDLSVSEDYVMTVERNTKPSASSKALKVRCNSTLTKDDLIGSKMRKQEEVNSLPRPVKKIEKPKPTRSHSPVMVGREMLGAIAAKQAEAFISKPPKIPPYPNEIKRSPLVQRPGEPKSTTKQGKTPDSKEDSLKDKGSLNENISQKIQYFEERQFEEPPKTIYHAREDSSPDEGEVMRLIEENMRNRSKEGYHLHKELSTSLTDIKDIFGERQTNRVNFHMDSSPTRPPDESNDYPQAFYDEIHHHHELSPDGSIDFFEELYRSRSVSPQSQSSSFLQRVCTGEVQKMKEHFETINQKEQHRHSDHFFGVSSLRKVRSDSDLNLNSGSKDALNSNIQLINQNNQYNMDADLLTHKMFRSNSQRGRSRKRNVLSPIGFKNRLMPHIDIISKTAALHQNIRKTSPQRPPSPGRSNSSNSGAVERIKTHFECGLPNANQYISSSNPDFRDINSISPHLTADWIAHKYPDPKQNTACCHGKPILKRSNLRCRSISPPRPRKCAKHQEFSIINHPFRPYYDDIFANQNFDPKKHQPKARYVPVGAEDSGIKQKSSRSLNGNIELIKKSMAVTFQDTIDNAPPIPPQPPIKGYYNDMNGNWTESPNKYFESDVNIHFKTPVRHEYKQSISEEELGKRQSEQMQKLYHEERRRKYLQELQDMNARRHTDNFTPSQKSPIALNRYDDFSADLAPKSPSNQYLTKTIARALYNFQGQNARELSFKKGDIIYLRRQIDKNWYEGEFNAMFGLLPANYVEIISRDGIQTKPKKPSEGQARAKYNFQAQSGVELSLNKGELVTLTRRVDENWFEGKIANRKGIFPVSYVEVLTDIGAEDIAAKTTVITNYSTTNLRPTLDILRTNINNEFNTLTQNGNHPVNGILKETKNGYKTDLLHVDTHSEPLAYRALYKYRPQNSDELELLEGDIVHVLEKCDDGWFVGTSQRTGCFGTFPGNYVERV